MPTISSLMSATRKVERLAIAAIAEEDQVYDIQTPYGKCGSSAGRAKRYTHRCLAEKLELLRQTID